MDSVVGTGGNMLAAGTTMILYLQTTALSRSRQSNVYNFSSSKNQKLLQKANSTRLLLKIVLAQPLVFIHCVFLRLHLTTELRC
ncbi:hypothetical protein HanIR_Chr17g0851461 [Helianthus annuus]|nr:hypothetical protein HanIR_Chr17g0851461 [Helianthus annuus]